MLTEGLGAGRGSRSAHCSRAGAPGADPPAGSAGSAPELPGWTQELCGGKVER